jgi:AcrR family transcriptional regulator
MALYRHVPDSDALLSGVMDAIVAGAPDVIDLGDLDGDLVDWARRFHAYLVQFPGVAGQLLTGWFESVPMLERVEDLLALVGAHDIDGFAAVAVTNAVFSYVLMRAEAERRVRSAGVVKRRLRTAGSSKDLPRLRSLANHYTTAEFDVHFEFGLNALIAGMNLTERAS